MLLNNCKANSIYDFNECVTLVYHEPSKRIILQKALKTKEKNTKSEFLCQNIAFDRANWYLPLLTHTKNLRIKDEIIDSENKTWIITEIKTLTEHNVLRFKAIHEMTGTDTNVYVNIYRVTTNNSSIDLTTADNDTLIYSNIPAVIVDRAETVSHSKTLQNTKGTETLEMLIEKNSVLYVSDIIVLNSDEIFELVSVHDIFWSTQWQKVMAKRQTGLHHQWVKPFA